MNAVKIPSKGLQNWESRLYILHPPLHLSCPIWNTSSSCLNGDSVTEILQRFPRPFFKKGGVDGGYLAREGLGHIATNGESLRDIFHQTNFTTTAGQSGNQLSHTKHPVLWWIYSRLWHKSSVGIRIQTALCLKELKLKKGKGVKLILS